MESRQYTFNNSTLIVKFGNILDTQAEGLCLIRKQFCCEFELDNLFLILNVHTLKAYASTYQYLLN